MHTRSRISILATEGSTDARFYRIIMYGIAVSKRCRASIINIDKRRLSEYGAKANMLNMAIKEAQRILPGHLHSQLRENILLVECTAEEAIPVFTVSFGGKNKLLGYLRRQLQDAPGLPEPQKGEVMLAALPDLDAYEEIKETLSKASPSKLCEKAYMQRRARLTILLGIQGLKTLPPGDQPIPCLPGGNLEDYLSYILPQALGSTAGATEIARL